MPKFSEISKAKLATCHPDLVLLFTYVIKNYDCTIAWGHRGKVEQDAAYANGNSQLQWPNSRHNSTPSNAVDAVPYEIGGIDWGKTQSAFFAGYVKATADMLFEMGLMKHKIRLGIDWDKDNDVDDTSFWDGAHFEIINN